MLTQLYNAAFFNTLAACTALMTKSCSSRLYSFSSLCCKAISSWCSALGRRWPNLS